MRFGRFISLFRLFFEHTGGCVDKTSCLQGGTPEVALDMGVQYLSFMAIDHIYSIETEVNKFKIQNGKLCKY